MDLDAFMKIETAANVRLDGESSDADLQHPHEIEIISFEHTIKRTPNRELTAHHLDLDRSIAELLQRENPNIARGILPILVRLAKPDLEERLAHNLEEGRLVVYKCVDNTTPTLCDWAGRAAFLASVAVTVRAPMADNVQAVQAVQRDMFTIVLGSPWIVDYEMVGDYQVQPWGKPNMHPLVAHPLMEFGPVERIEFAYKTVGWKYGAQAANKVGWDFANKREQIPQ